MKQFRGNVWQQKPPLGSQPDPDWLSDMGIVGYWPFIEGVGTQINDYSGNRNTGTYLNPASPQTQWQAGTNNTVLGFNSSLTQSADFGQNSSLLITGGITFGIRIFLAASFTTGYQVGVSRWNNNGGQRAWWIGMSSAGGSGANAQVFLGDPAGDLANLQSAQAQSFFVGSWHDLIATWSPFGTVTFYVDGQFSSSVIFNHASLGSTALDTIAGSQSGGGGNWNGQLDRPILAQKMWTPNQVAQYCANPWAGWIQPYSRRFAPVIATPPIVENLPWLPGRARFETDYEYLPTIRGLQ